MSDHDLLRRQFDLTWSLFDYHLERLVPEDHLREPAGPVWTVRDGVPDRSETEPGPVPVPTIAWVTWHLLMKNVAEIGQLRLLRAATPTNPDVNRHSG